MKYLDLTLPTPEANLACDEALVDLCEEGCGSEVLRFWEPPDLFVVVGYANRVEDEVHRAACRRRNVPVLRRCSGGGTVLQGRGCLNYSLVLKITDSGPLQSIAGTNALIMGTHREALQPMFGEAVAVQGHTDLTLQNRKFSGNAQRRKRHFLLFHGTFLLSFDLARMGDLLRVPAKRPWYRQDRSHLDFLTNLNRPADAIKEALKKVWKPKAPLDHLPWARIDQLVKTKYALQEWNFKF